MTIQNLRGRNLILFECISGSRAYGTDLPDTDICGKSYREYGEWVGKCNDAHYQNILDYGKNYDAKNMMHTFRLLDIVIKILKIGRVLVLV